MANGGKAKTDVERDRRLDEDEEERILACLVAMPEARAFFVLALETAMRMRECYTLELEQVGLAKKTIHLDRSKNGDGREVPLSSTIGKLLGEYIKVHADDIKARGGRLFSFWEGDRSVRALDAATVDVSLMFKDIFASAAVKDFYQSHGDSPIQGPTTHS
ncbi:tyrosine-type recombinase/integrase [Massilia violaceinigra]|uniref:tyrosine-type recombinase/integrase n=1 Tax=Massilia violaceinigra TaxID=2045208 RepID=UPI0012FD9C94|nr:tyrosine-type recombinase/integrase [Massilia violaceinigra]